MHKQTILTPYLKDENSFESCIHIFTLNYSIQKKLKYSNYLGEYSTGTKVSSQN